MGDEFNLNEPLSGDWGFGDGDWGLGIWANPQSPIPNPHPQSPFLYFIINYIIHIYYYIYIK